MSSGPQLAWVTVAAPPILAIVVLSLWGCSKSESTDPPLSSVDPSVGTEASASRTERTGVLLVSHGSHSPEWRKMLREFHESVEPQILAIPGIGVVKSAFMEYNEPSIATSLKEFDQEGYKDVILVPLLLTVSSHSFDDIPTIIGAKADAKSIMTLKAQRIERYTPQARVTITPLLDFSSLLQENLPRRIAALSQDRSREGVVLVAYGDEPYQEEWEKFFERLDQVVRKETGAAEVSHCWCGHIVRYSKAPTTNAIRQILSQHDRAIVVPVLVACDDFFQNQIIGGAVEEVGAGDRVAYIPDAILPDPKLSEWVVSITRQTRARIHGRDARGEEPTP